LKDVLKWFKKYSLKKAKNQWFKGACVAPSSMVGPRHVYKWNEPSNFVCPFGRKKNKNMTYYYYVHHYFNNFSSHNCF
jgi:hypothetical protein